MDWNRCWHTSARIWHCGNQRRTYDSWLSARRYWNSIKCQLHWRMCDRSHFRAKNVNLIQWTWLAAARSGTHHVRRHNFHHIQMEIIYFICCDKSVCTCTFARECHGYGEASGCRRRDSSSKFKWIFHCVIHETAIGKKLTHTHRHTNTYLQQFEFNALPLEWWATGAFHRRPIHVCWRRRRRFRHVYVFGFPATMHRVVFIRCNQFLWQAIVGPKGFALKIQRVLEYPPRQQLYIELKDRLRRKTNFTLNMRWYSRLIPEPEGFYVDQYDGGNGVKRYRKRHAADCRCCSGQMFLLLIFGNNSFCRFLAATVFRPGGARRAFPCFDEPHLRAPFHVSLFRDRFHIGLSNSIVYATEDLGFYMGVGLVSAILKKRFPSKASPTKKRIAEQMEIGTTHRVSFQATIEWKLSR